MATIHVHDCETGDQAAREMTPEEEAAHLATQADAEAGALYREAAREQREADLALLTSHPAIPDDLRAALRRLVGAP